MELGGGSYWETEKEASVSFVSWVRVGVVPAPQIGHSPRLNSPTIMEVLFRCLYLCVCIYIILL